MCVGVYVCEAGRVCGCVFVFLTQNTHTHVPPFKKHTHTTHPPTDAHAIHLGDQRQLLPATIGEVEVVPIGPHHEQTDVAPV